MGIKKKKHLDNVVFVFSPDVMTDIERHVSENEDEALKIINQIICSCDGKHQMALFKEVESVLLGKQSNSAAQVMAINVLGEMYYQINSRSSLKRTASSVLQALSVAHPELVSTALADPLKTVVSISSEIAFSHIKNTMAQILTLFDNFPAGKLAVDENSFAVLQYISRSVNTLLQDLSDENSPQQTSDLYNVCQSTLKVLNIILQQCNFHNYESECELYLRTVLEGVIYLLNDSFTLLNCRINAGIAFSLLLRSIDDRSSYMAYLKHHDNLGNHTVAQGIRKFPAVSQLCIWSGVMAVLSVEELIAAETECLLFGKILHEIISLSERKEDTVIIASSARVLLQWLDVTAQIFDSERCHDSMKQKFSEDSETIRVLLQYVWTNWEHFMDCVQYHTRDIFRKIITLHIRSQDVDPRSSSFLRNLCCSLLEMPWHRRGKYSVLCCLAEHLGPAVLIELHPTLSTDLYHALSDASLASHVSELCDVLFKSSNVEFDQLSFENVWLRPLIDTMCNASKPQRCGLTEHILPKLFAAYPNSVRFLVSELSSLLPVQTGNTFSALIACGKVAQKCGIYKSSKEHNDLWCGCIPQEVLEGALCHSDDQVRLSAFSLICDSPKTTECLTTSEFDLIRISLPLNINIQCPAFRQQFVSFVKKFLLRVKESAYTFFKKLRRNRNDEISVQKCLVEYQEFLLWLKNFLFFCLHPGGNFPRRVTALSLLALYCNVFSGVDTPPEFGVLVDQESQAQTLVDVLRDTYENNKQHALDILAAVRPALLNFQDRRRSEDMFDAGLLLLSSTKPPDSETASFIFALMCQHDVSSVILEKLTALKGESDLFSSTDLSSLDANCNKDVSLAAICVLCIQLNSHLNTAKRSLLEAAAKCPLYGILICIRKILTGLCLNSLSAKNSVLQWQIIFSKLISLCFEVVYVVEPVVCNSSPEGHLPMDTGPESIQQLQTAVQNAISGRYQNAIVNADSTDSSLPSIDLVKTKAVTAQMLLLCCWRAHKEVSLLLGWISENVPVSDPQEDNVNMLSTSQVVEIGRFFIRQLCVLKHRGGFEQAYVGFCKLCHRLWRSSIRDLHKLPQEWLKQLFSAICQEEDSIRLCPTRRSAGLPFIFQALLVSELDATGSSCFKQAMSTLLDLAQPHSQKYSLECRVHAVNVLRALYRDSCLGESVMSYASDGIKVAIGGFQGMSWAVRNAATLLFSTLMTRIFGVNRSRDEVQRKNCMTGRVFFFRFPDLFEFLLNELKSCVAALNIGKQNASGALQPSLYPILLLLGRLYPSTIEGSDSNLKLTAFVPYLRQCTDSAIWKTRILAAKALVPLLSPDEYPSILEELFSSLSSSSRSARQNQIHGVLLQILYILKEVLQLPVPHRMKIKKMLSAWMRTHLWLSGDRNRCYITRAAFMEIVYFTLSENLISGTHCNAETILKDLLQEIRSSSCPPGKAQFITLSSYVSFLHILLQQSHHTVSSFASEDVFPINSTSVEDLIVCLLMSQYYEARTITLQFLLWICDNNQGYINLSDEFVLLKNISWNIPVICEEKMKFKNMVTKNRIISNCLVNVLASETHPECLARIHQLMFLMYDGGAVNWISLPFKTAVTFFEKLQWVLDQIQNCKNDDVKNAMLLFSSSLAKLAYDALFQDFSIHNLETFIKWTREVEHSSLSDQSISGRLTVVSILKHVNESILLDTYGILGHSVCSLWQAFLHLLEDDEPDVKRLAGEIVIGIRKSCNNDFPVYALPVVPAKAIDLMIGLFVEKFGQSIPSECLSMLVGWMLRSEGEQLEVHGDEQPFDKGEMNVFAEDFALTVLVKHHLPGFFRLHREPEELKIITSLVPAWKNYCAAGAVEYLSVQECVMLCLDETSDLLNKFASSVSHSPFVNRHFDETSLRISQRVQVLSALMVLCSTKKSEFRLCSERILKMLKTIKHVNRFLADVIDCVTDCLSDIH